MSAYDNPTIIKDDSAMAWATAFSGIGQAFTESFNTARREREAKEKEARLEAERKEKDRKEQALSKQILYSKNTAAISEEISSSRATLEKIGVSQTITDQLLGFKRQYLTKEGENNVVNMTEEVGKDKLDADAQYASEANALWSNATRMLGGGASQMQAIYNGDVGKTNAELREFIGDDDITRLKNAVISARSWSGKNTEQKLIYDINNPKAGMTVNIIAKNLAKDELELYISSVNPKIKNNNQFEDFIKSNPEVIKANSDGTYNIVYNEDVADKKSGEFYVDIPEPKKDTDLQTAGVYNDKDQLQDMFFEGPKYVNAQDNAGISKSEAIIKVPKRLVKMQDIDALIEKQVKINMKGLLGSKLQDMNALRGFMRLTGSGDTGVEDAKRLVTLPLEEQINILSKPIIDGYRTEIMRNNSIRQDKDGNYYQLDEMALKEFDANQGKTKTAGPTNKQLADQAKLQAEIKKVHNMQAGDKGRMEFGKNRVAHIDGAFIIETPGELQGEIIGSKDEVISFLQYGTYTPKK